MRITDANGVWEDDGSIRLLIEPTPEWIAQNQPVVEPQQPEPTMEDYLIDLDYRLCLVELGLN